VVIDQSDLPRNLRNLANRKATPGKPPTDRSVVTQAAQLGFLRRGNTKKGTRGRQAVDRATRLSRRQRRPDVSAREALGHRSKKNRPAQISLMVADPPRFIIIETFNRTDLHRAGRYDHLVNLLAARRIAPSAFERRVNSWRPIAGERFLADPEAVLTLLDRLRAEDRETFVYDSGRSS
jgi:hypothetical protein